MFQDMDSLIKERASLLAAVGCGVALGVSGIYSFYKLNQRFCDRMEDLTNTIENLRQEVVDLKLSSKAASSIQTPLPCDCYNFMNQKNDIDSEDQILTGDDVSNVDFARIQHDSDDNEEFFDVEENSTEIGNKSSLFEQNLHSKKKNLTLKEWLKYFDSRLEDFSNDKQELYDEIKKALSKYENTSEILWRMSKATHLLSISASKEGDDKKRKRLVFEALGYAKEALKKDNQNPDCHKWYSIAIGSINDYVPIKEKIQNGYEFRKHVDLALKLNPMDATLHHMLGRWCFEVASLSWIEKKVATTIFSQTPESTYEDSLKSLFEAYRLKPQWKENILFVAKVLVCQKKFKEAMEWIEKGLSIKSIGEDDALAHEELKVLQLKYLKYK